MIGRLTNRYMFHYVSSVLFTVSTTKDRYTILQNGSYFPTQRFSTVVVKITSLSTFIRDTGHETVICNQATLPSLCELNTSRRLSTSSEVDSYLYWALSVTYLHCLDTILNSGSRLVESFIWEESRRSSYYVSLY